MHNIDIFVMYKNIFEKETPFIILYNFRNCISILKPVTTPKAIYLNMLFKLNISRHQHKCLSFLLTKKRTEAIKMDNTFYGFCKVR